MEDVIMEIDINKTAQYVYDNLTHGDFSMDELKQILEKRDIKLNNKQLGSLISELRKYGVSYDESLQVNTEMENENYNHLSQNPSYMERDFNDDFIPLKKSENNENLKILEDNVTNNSIHKFSESFLKDKLSPENIKNFEKYAIKKFNEISNDEKKKIKNSNFIRKCLKNYLLKSNDLEEINRIFPGLLDVTELNKINAIKNKDRTISFWIENIKKILNSRGVNEVVGLEQYINKKLNENDELLIAASNFNEKTKNALQETLIDGYLAYLNYLYSLTNVKIQDANLSDLVNNLIKTTEDEKAISNFEEKYPTQNNVDYQVKVQDANNTVATAAINAAMRELGSDASSKEIKDRSLEILNEATYSGKSK